MYDRAVGRLDEDTAVTATGSGRFSASLSPDWNIWGPNGGYVASVALRAAAAASEFTRPASIMCHFLSSARFDAVALTVETLRRAKRAEALRVSMTQEGAPVLEALVWLVTPGDGLEHDHAPPPGVPPPEDLASTDALRPDDAPRTRFSFFGNVEERPTAWIEDWENREPGEPRVTSWFRFRPVATFADPIVDACRSLILIDTMEWPAAVRAHRADHTWMAPSLDLAVRFHRFEPTSEWLLSDTVSAIAADGLVGGTSATWSADGRLLASGGQQMLCRPMRPSA